MTTFAEVSALLSKLSEEVKQKHPILNSWSVKWNKRLRTVMGRAVRKASGEKYIELSHHLVLINKNTPDFITRIKETILHEWAHALDWEKDKGWGHGASWKKWMLALGVPPERCFDSGRWLCALNKVKFAIRNGRTGKVLVYSNEISPSLILTAMENNNKQGGSIEDVEVIDLKTGNKVGR